MNRRTYQAPTMSEALAAVKRELGGDAVIIASRTVPPKPNGRRGGVEITAQRAGAGDALLVRPRTKQRGVRHAATTDASARLHVDHHRPGNSTEDAPSRMPAARNSTDPNSLPPLLRDLYTRLVQNEVAYELAERIVRQAADDIECGMTDDHDETGLVAGAERVFCAAAAAETSAEAAIRSRMRDLIRDMLPPAAEISLAQGEARRVALIGPPGSGKTTALAKLAAQFKLREGRRVALLSLDTLRLAAHEQLGRYAELIGVPLHTAQSVVEVHDVLRKTDADLLLIDTPGVAPREDGRFVRLAALLRAARPQEIHLALPAGLNRPAQLATMQRFAPLRVSHLMLTRLDEAVGLGVLLTTLERLRWPLSYMTAGQRVPTDIAPADREQLADLIVAPA